MSRPTARRLLAAVAGAALLALGACSSDDLPPPPGEAKIDVDTPALATMKKEAGIADCVPGNASDAELPDVTLPCFGGGPDVDLSSLRGPLVLNLFASWCGPCRAELPVLQQFHERYGDRVDVVGVDYTDPQTTAAMQLVRRSGVTYPLLADPQSDLQGAAPFPNRMGLPLFAFVAADGSVEVTAGGVDSLDEMVRLADDHLGIDL